MSILHKETAYHSFILYFRKHSVDVLHCVFKRGKAGGNRHSLHADFRRLEARAHGTRIVDVAAEVEAAVDARNYQIERFLHSERGDAHAVGGGGIDAVRLHASE